MPSIKTAARRRPRLKLAELLQFTVNETGAELRVCIKKIRNVTGHIWRQFVRVLLERKFMKKFICTHTNRHIYIPI